MNLELLDPFRSHFPEMIEDSIGDNSTTISFNRRGNLLASGTFHGLVVVWDFETRRVGKILEGHSRKHPITSVSWSRDSHKLLSSSNDWTLILFDVLSGSIDVTLQFESVILSAQIHPYKRPLCIACPYMASCHLVHLDTGEKKILPDPTIDNDTNSPLNLTQKRSPLSTVACFDKKGEFIFTGHSTGQISIISTQTLELQNVVKLGSSSAPIKQICFDLSGERFLVNSADRSIRLCLTSAPGLVIREFRDPITHMQWKKCTFSNDGEYVIAGSAQKSHHRFHVWSMDGGILVRTLEGPKEGVLDVSWHPTRPVIVSLSVTGVSYIWGCPHTENWSAFAPDFKELEENVEYIEREDEFDLDDDYEGEEGDGSEQAPKRRRKNEIEEDVDVTTIEKVAFFGSDSEDEDELFFIPITIEKEDPLSFIEPPPEIAPPPAPQRKQIQRKPGRGGKRKSAGRHRRKPKQNQLARPQSVQSEPQQMQSVQSEPQQLQSVQSEPQQLIPIEEAPEHGKLPTEQPQQNQVNPASYPTELKEPIPSVINEESLRSLSPSPISEIEPTLAQPPPSSPPQSQRTTDLREESQQMESQREGDNLGEDTQLKKPMPSQE